MSHKFLKSLILSYLFLYTPWVELPGIGIGIGIGLDHVHTQDSWYWSWIISNINTSLGIGLDSYKKSRHLLVLVSKNVSFQDLSWYWSWNKNDVKTSLGLGLEQNKWSHRTLSQMVLFCFVWSCTALRSYAHFCACFNTWAQTIFTTRPRIGMNINGNLNIYKTECKALCKGSILLRMLTLEYPW